MSDTDTTPHKNFGELARRSRTLVRQPAAAAYIQHAERTMEKWRVSGEGPRYIKLGHIILYDLNELDRFVEERIQRSTAENPPPGARPRVAPPAKRPRGRPRKEHPIDAAAE